MADPLLISTDDQNAAEALANDIRKSNSDGISLDVDGNGTGDVPYVPDLLPVKDFNILFPPGTEKDTKKITNGLKVASIPTMRRFRPFGYHGEVLGPSLSFSAATDLVTITVAPGNRISVPRQVMASANIAAAAATAGARFDFWVEVDGTPTTKHRFLFTNATEHLAFGSTWLIALPANAAIIKLRGERGTGSGNLLLDANDFASLTLLG